MKEIMGEASCELGGNYGLCKQHPTCVIVQGLLNTQRALLDRWLKLIREPSSEDVHLLEKDTAQACSEFDGKPRRG